MQTLTVDLGDRSYPITIGTGVLRQEFIAPYIRSKQVMLVTNETVAPLYRNTVYEALQGFQVDEVVLPDGEAYKDLTHLNLIFDQLLHKRHNRTTTLIALGGGVVGDMTGFAAACYQRGVNFIQIPTTLLSQVDSSVGGKTGVNHPAGKNMIGAFHQPVAVLADTQVLNTLPDVELSAGIAEVIKYGLIYDENFFAWLESNMQALRQRDPNAIAYAIYRSCEIKAEMVRLDERESGVRALLNLGHTFGHAIETHAGYGQWLHGQAVAAGTMMAADLSCRMGWITAADVVRIEQLFKAADLPVKPPSDMTPDRFSELMSIDKKVMDGKLRLVLMQRIGQAIVTDQFDQAALMQTLQGQS
ncbi:3-dehydroquinate synthase [Nitrincola schmidtii]|uniref:3-dehydroquinate synthase n=1 Tax=Nitrincola schmidtii TaxID=1730894 RepID=UPI00124C2708|nr:3-dehydroquinate synthase [Nitrincola schmidtii]